ncbi:MAG: STAS domain-containing protein [Kibdelosporangium sp.]
MVPMLDPDEMVTVTVSELSAACVIEVSGEIDMGTCDRMADPVFDRLAERPRTLVIDLTKVEFIGSAGLNVLIEAQKRAKDGVTVLHVVASTQPVLRPLEISGLRQFLSVRHSLAEALRDG